MDSFRPLVRFAGFEGEWERVRLGEIAQFFKGKGYSKNDLTEKGSPIFLYGMMYTKYRFAVNEVDTYTDKDFSSLLSQGNEVIIPASGETAEDIACASAFLIKDVILGGDLNVICFDLSLYSTPFIALSISNGSSRKYLSKCAQGKSVVHLRNSDIKTVVLSLPSLPEQQAIANYFTKLDEELTLQSQKLSKLKQIKAASLQNMFPQEGQTVPLVRFSGFGGEWEKVPFAEIAVRAEQSGVSGELPGVEYEDIVSGQGILNKDILKKECVKCGKLFHSGDILFGKLRPYLKNILFADFDGVAVGDFWVLRSTNSVNRFLYTIVNSYSFMKVANVSSGSKMPRADWKLVSSTRFAVPPTIEEQQAIANYFTKLDRKIELETQKLEKLKQIKSACLSKMFV